MMVAIWGIVGILAKTFGVNTGVIPPGPGYENPTPPGRGVRGFN